MKADNKNFLKQIEILKHALLTAQLQRNGVARYKVIAYSEIIAECENETNERKITLLYRKLLSINPNINSTYGRVNDSLNIK